METIGKTTLWSFVDGKAKAQQLTNTEIRSDRGHRVTSFLDLATKVAELQFRNRDVVLLYRGQRGDHRNRYGNTSLKPRLFRAGADPSPNPPVALLEERFKQLQQAETELVKRYTAKKLLGVERLNRHQILRWSILQHYEVCPTPLLDVTHSLRIAASFASLDAGREAFLFVLGVPNLSGAITASAEAGLQIVRLSSVCPPAAVRPHIQEGYLVGEYPELSGIDRKQHYQHFEIDLGRRLVAKFRLSPKRFWKGRTFPQVGRDALYPAASQDPLFRLALEVMKRLKV
jgi:hypothetical protein